MEGQSLSSSPDYKLLFREAEAARKKAEKQHRQAEEQRINAEKRTQSSTFDEYIALCHNLLSIPLKAGHPSRSTKGSIPAPTGKYCPTRLREWRDFTEQQSDIYDNVRRFLEPSDRPSQRLFSTSIALEDLGRTLCSRPIGSEKDLEGWERYGKDRHVGDIVEALCKIPEACRDFQLSLGLRFDSHTNMLDGEAAAVVSAERSSRRMQPDQFCVHRNDESMSTLLLTIEYKPPHKLSVENLCAGLREMDFWEEVVNSVSIPTDAVEKLQYNAALLAGAAVVQQYHVMIQEGLAYSCVSTGLALVFLHVREDDPTTLYYHLCVPNRDMQEAQDSATDQPLTAVGRLLCFCLMACRTRPRSNSWRNMAKRQVHVWETDFEYALSQIPDEEFTQTPPGSDYVPSSPLSSPAANDGRRVLRSQARCTPLAGRIYDEDSDHSESDPRPSTQRRKRTYSAIGSSPPPQTGHSEIQMTQDRQEPRQQDQHHSQDDFCTQACLLGLQQGSTLDEACPNILSHRNGKMTDRHSIGLCDWVTLLKEQLDNDVDHLCAPFGQCGATGAPFKISCASYGYTIVGKGTTTRLWETVLRESSFYRTLRSVQATAVPVFLGTVNLKQTYFLHGAGEIQHMLLMAWAGTALSEEQYRSKLEAVRRSVHDVHKLGVKHGDLRLENMLWNKELKRVLLIDFDASTLVGKHLAPLKRKASLANVADGDRHRVVRQRNVKIET